MQDLKAMTEAQDNSSSPASEEVTAQQVADAKRAARAAADALMLTDAPLLFPPGQLALAAMRSGFNKVCGHLCISTYIGHGSESAPVPRSLASAWSVKP